MAHLNELSFFSFDTTSQTVRVQYFFSKEGFGGQVVNSYQVWLAIQTDQFTIKVLKPHTILFQPQEIIEKIVEREVLQHFANELIQNP